MQYLKTFESYFHTKFEPILNDIHFNFIRSRKYSVEDGRLHTAQFYGKDGNLYYIVKTVNEDSFRVYDSIVLDNGLKNGHGVTPVAIAFFDTSKLNSEDKFFTGYTHNDSIEVNPEYRRKGLATALTDFAEQFYKAPYKPSALLSAEMQKFVDNRFKNKE
jgi:ribosomal protein S18 acetylase RimI-like enzyme